MNEMKDDRQNIQERDENDDKPTFSNIQKLKIDNDFEHIEQTIVEERYEEF